jgi:hypothetical protein
MEHGRRSPTHPCQSRQSHQSEIGKGTDH